MALHMVVQQLHFRSGMAGGNLKDIESPAQKTHFEQTWARPPPHVFHWHVFDVLILFLCFQSLISFEYAETTKKTPPSHLVTASAPARRCQEYLRSLREILAKAAVDVNTFGAGGAA